MAACWRVLIVGILWVIVTVVPAAAQQRGNISGRVLDAGGLVLPGASVTATEQGSGFSREVVAAETGAYLITNLDPGTYTVVVGPRIRSGQARESPVDRRLVHDARRHAAGRRPPGAGAGHGRGAARRDVEQSDWRHPFRSGDRGDSVELPELHRVDAAGIPASPPTPASTFEGGQVVANGTPSQQNVYLIDGMYNNDDRLGGSQGTQVRMVLDNIAEYQVLTDTSSAEYGGGAGTIINMISRGGTNDFHGRAYSYFRDDRFNARNAFLPASAAKPQERTMQAGFAMGGPIVQNRAHFYFTMEKDHEDLAGQKRFPAAAAPLARDMVGTFQVRATNYFGRGDLQLNQQNMVSFRWVLETAPTRGEGFNTNTQTIDSSDLGKRLGPLHEWDRTRRSSTATRTNELRIGRIGEELGTGAQAFFDDNVETGRVRRTGSLLDRAAEYAPELHHGQGRRGTERQIRTYMIDETFSYFRRASGAMSATSRWAPASAITDAPAHDVQLGHI